MKYIFLLVALLTIATSATATEKIITLPCKKTYTADSYISITITDVVPSYSAAQQKYNEKIKMVEKLATESGLKKFDLQNSSINISPYNNGATKTFNLSGNLSYRTQEDEDMLFAFMDALERNSIQASYSNSKSLAGSSCQ